MTPPFAVIMGNLTAYGPQTDSFPMITAVGVGLGQEVVVG